MSRTDPHRTVHRRRRFAALVTAVVVLAACGGGDGSSTDATDEAAADTTVAETAVAETADSAVFPVTIDHKYGSTTVDAAPVRVVSVGYTDQDFLLALGVTPVGVRDWYGDQPSGVWPWAQDELGDAEPALLVDEELSFEQIAALEPDLIVGISSGMTEDQYTTLSKIAPTIAQPGEFVDYGTPWQDQTLMTGAAVGKPDEAAALVAELDAEFAAVRETHADFLEATGAVAFYYNDQPGAYASQDGRSRILTDLGFTIPAALDEIAGDSFFASFSAEQIDLLDTDVIVWIGGDELTVASLVDSPLRGGMRAAQEGREVFADVELGGAFSFGSPLSLPYLIEHLVPELALAVDGDPATVVPSAEALGATGEAAPSAGGSDATGTPEGEAATDAWALVFDSTADPTAKAPHLEDAEALAGTLADYASTGDTMGGISLAPTGVTIEGDTATITYDVMFGSAAAYEALTGTIRNVDGTWVVGRDEFCGFMSSARLSCP